MDTKLIFNFYKVIALVFRNDMQSNVPAITIICRKYNKQKIIRNKNHHYLNQLIWRKKLLNNN